MGSSYQNGNTSTNLTEDFFSFLMDNESPVRNLSIIFCSLSALLVPILLYSLIWFDKYGSDNRRTFENMLNSKYQFHPHFMSSSYI